MAEIDLNRWLRCNLTINFPSHPENAESFFTYASILSLEKEKKRKEKLTNNVA